MLWYQKKVHLENQRTFHSLVIGDFPAEWNYGKFSANFFISRGRIINTVGSLFFFKVLIEQLLKFLLITIITPRSEYFGL